MRVCPPPWRPPVRGPELAGGRVDDRRRRKTSPDAGRLVVAGDVPTGRAGENGREEPAGSRPSVAVRKLEEPGQLLGLEVRAEAPVSEHLEEGRMPGVADLVDVLGAKARLGVDEAVAGRVGWPEQIGDQRLHPGPVNKVVGSSRGTRLAPGMIVCPRAANLIEVSPTNSLAAERRHRGKDTHPVKLVRSRVHARSRRIVCTVEGCGRDASMDREVQPRGAW